MTSTTPSTQLSIDWSDAREMLTERRPDAGAGLKLLGLGGMPPRAVIDEAHWRRHADRMLATIRRHDLDAQIARHVAETQPELMVLRIDPLSNAILATHGASAAVLAILAHRIRDGVSLRDDANADVVGIEIQDLLFKGEPTPFLTVSAEIASGVRFIDGCIVHLTDLPEMLMVAMAERPLADMISHPWIDGLGLVVSHAQGRKIHPDWSGSRPVFAQTGKKEGGDDAG